MRSENATKLAGTASLVRPPSSSFRLRLLPIDVLVPTACNSGFTLSGSTCVSTSPATSTTSTTTSAAAAVQTICATSNDCVGLTIPANSNHYCKSKVCSYRSFIFLPFPSLPFLPFLPSSTKLISLSGAQVVVPATPPAGRPAFLPQLVASSARSVPSAMMSLFSRASRGMKKVRSDVSGLLPHRK
jgi:hypothetical protein